LQEQYRKQAEADLAKATEEPHGMAKYAPMIMGIVGDLLYTVVDPRIDFGTRGR